MPSSSVAVAIDEEATVSGSTGLVDVPSTEPKRSIGRFTLRGLAGGLFFGALLSVMEYFFRGRNLHDVSLTTYLVLFPMIGAGLGSLYQRCPEMWYWRRPASFFAVGPLSAEER